MYPWLSRQRPTRQDTGTDPGNQAVLRSGSHPGAVSLTPPPPLPPGNAGRTQELEESHADPS